MFSTNAWQDAQALRGVSATRGIRLQQHASLPLFFPVMSPQQCDRSSHVVHESVTVSYTSRTAFTHPSNSGLFVTCAIFPHATFPVVVTNPNSLTLTSTIVPFVKTPGESARVRRSTAANRVRHPSLTSEHETHPNSYTDWNLDSSSPPKCPIETTFSARGASRWPSSSAIPSGG